MSATLSEASLDSLVEIRNWFGSVLGTRVLETEQVILDQLLTGFFGYHLLQASILDTSLYDSSPIQNKFSIGLDTHDAVPMVARATELPFENDSIDVILIHHLLDFLDSPLDTLREITRVSLPMGYLVIVGFNPISSWGLWKLTAAMTGKAPWTGKFIRPGRLMDWLNVLNFKIDRAQYCIYGPPFVRKNSRNPGHSKDLSRTLNLPFGAAYIIVARKQIGTITPIRPVWHTTGSFGRLSVVRD